jgi:hypothetical protein
VGSLIPSTPDKKGRARKASQVGEATPRGRSPAPATSSSRPDHKAMIHVGEFEAAGAPQSTYAGWLLASIQNCKGKAPALSLPNKGDRFRFTWTDVGRHRPTSRVTPAGGTAPPRLSRTRPKERLPPPGTADLRCTEAGASVRGEASAYAGSSTPRSGLPCCGSGFCRGDAARSPLGHVGLRHTPLRKGRVSSAGRPGGGGDRASLRTRPSSIETTDGATRLARPVQHLAFGAALDAVGQGALVVCDQTIFHWPLRFS